MANTWGVSRRISDRIRIGVAISRWGMGVGGSWEAGFRPPGEASGRWVGIGPVWVRLVSCASGSEPRSDC